MSRLFTASTLAVLLFACGEEHQVGVEVLRIRADHAAGHVLKAEDLDSVRVPSRALQTRHLKATLRTEVVGKRLRNGVTKGDHLLQSDFDKDYAQPTPQKNHALIFLPVKVADGTLLRPGDLIALYVDGRAQDGPEAVEYRTLTTNDARNDIGNVIDNLMIHELHYPPLRPNEREGLSVAVLSELRQELQEVLSANEWEDIGSIVGTDAGGGCIARRVFAPKSES